MRSAKAPVKPAPGGSEVGPVLPLRMATSYRPAMITFSVPKIPTKRAG